MRAVAEPAVTGQVLESPIALERRAALPFVRQFLAAADQVAEEAALALFPEKHTL